MDSSELKDLGNNEFRNGNYQSAIKYFDEAIEKDSENHILYSNRSAAYLSPGNGQQAFTDAEKCVNLEPTWAKGYGRKGAALHMLKKYEEAISCFEEGLKLESDNSYLTNPSGLSLRKYQLKAIEAVEELLSTNPKRRKALLAMVICNCSSND